MADGGQMAASGPETATPVGSAPVSGPSDGCVGAPGFLSEALRRYTRDPFARFFENRSADDIIEPGSLLDTPNVRRWFELFSAGLPQSLYTYQLPLEIACGPEIRVLGTPLVLFSTYSYLGLVGHPRIQAAVVRAVERFGTSTGGVRLLTGTNELHREVEHELADFLGQEAAATFASGYDANVAAITSLFGSSDYALLDQYAHQSIHDGVRMAGCETRRFRHNDMDDLERRVRQARTRGARRILIAVDAVFSMDGDEAPLADLIEVKRRHGAFLLVDEAHSIGAIGATGRGICEAQNIDPAELDIVTGSLSKGIPSSGGFAAGARDLKIYLQHGSAPYMFSAAMTPANAAAVLESIRILRDEPVHIQRLRENTAALLNGLHERGYRTGSSTTPVVPLLLGDEWTAYKWARAMLERGVFVSAVVYPAVSPGQARLRLCATAGHRDEHFQRLFDALEYCRSMSEDEPRAEAGAGMRTGP
ncbi:MAG: pyridoxal phosphate-dependent aminotransferase family protein [Gemmatimonadetes bacterium]|nr:pyridoxal phosphate-dependent aminotransferase family protein [Gemmatimonadota bacterium]